MMMGDVADVLVTWTPYLAAGFGWNMIVSLAAMAIGTAVGLLLAALRAGTVPGVKQTGSALTVFARGAPDLRHVVLVSPMPSPEPSRFWASS